MNATTEKTLLAALDRAEELRDEILALGQPGVAAKFGHLPTLVDDCRALAAIAGAEAPAVDLERDAVSAVLRCLLAFLDELIVSLQQRRSEGR